MKISTYSISSPTLDDILIGTDVSNSDETKNFRIGDIKTLFLGSTYVPYTGATSNVNLGNYSLLTKALTISNNLIADSSAGDSGYILKSMGANASPQWVSINSLIENAFVPYVGATGDVNLGAYSLSAGALKITDNLLVNLFAGNSGDVLKSMGAGVSPQWVAISTLIANAFKGSFYDSLTQTITTPQLATGIPVKLGTTDATCTNGISIVTDGTNLTRITFANAGTYNLLFSAQLANSGGGAQTVDFWLRKNGNTAAANIADTNGKVQLQAGTNFLMAAWNYFINVNAGDYIQLMWTSTSTNITIVAEAANAVHPATPSIIVTLNQV
jgi:hypothetical protein